MNEASVRALIRRFAAAGLPDGDYGDITVSGGGTVVSIDANAVGTAEIADGAVTFAKLAGAAVITSGETIAANDSDTAVPTSAAVIDYANSVGRVLLATKTASASATLDFTEFNNSVYRVYEFELENVKPATDAVQLLMRFSTNAGSSYDAGASDYQFSTIGRDASGGNTNGNATGATSIQLTASGAAALIGNAAAEMGVSGRLDLFNAGSASVYTRVVGKLDYDNSSGNEFLVIVGGRRTTAQDTDAVRFLFSSGNITSGTIRMFGVI